MMLDLDELEHVFAGRWFWSADKFALAWFRKQDHFISADSSKSLKSHLKNLLAEHGLKRPLQRVELLTQLRYLGFSMNPVCFYYCYDASEELIAIVAEVNNTPWGEQHHYVIPATNEYKHASIDELRKDFHVSPFMPMDMEYSMRFSKPAKKLAVRIENYQDNKKKLDVVMSMNRVDISTANLMRVLVTYPAITAKIFAAIYWQALKLAWKRTPFYSHPKKNGGAPGGSSQEPQLVPGLKTDFDTNNEPSVLVGR